MENDIITPQTQPSQTSAPNGMPPASPTEPSVQQPQTYKPPKSKKPLILILILVFLLAAGGAAYYFTKPSKDKTTTTSTTGTKKSVNAGKKQYAFGDSVAGYINYKPQAFKEITTAKIPTISQVSPDINSVIVEANITGFSGSGLFLYDLKTNKTYQLTDGGGAPRIMSDHYLLYGFDTGSGANKRLGGKLLDLQTGKTTTVFSDTPENTPGTNCCSVSPDGYKAAFVQKDKISVYDIRTDKTTPYTVKLTAIDPHFSRTASNDYNVEMSYATPQWLDNDTLIYSDNVAASEVTAGQAKQTVQDNLFSLNLTDNKSTSIAIDKGGIYNLYTANGSIYLDIEPMGETSTNLVYIKDAESKPLTLGPGLGFNIVSPDGARIYTFSPGANFVVYEPATGTSPTDSAFNPTIPDAKINEVLPRGWAGPDRMIVTELDTATAQTHEYIAVYNVTTNKLEQSVMVK